MLVGSPREELSITNNINLTKMKKKGRKSLGEYTFSRVEFLLDKARAEKGRKFRFLKFYDECAAESGLERSQVAYITTKIRRQRGEIKGTKYEYCKNQDNEA